MYDIMSKLSATGCAAGALEDLSGLKVYERSIAVQGGTVFFLGNRDHRHYLGILNCGSQRTAFDVAWREVSLDGQALWLGIGEENHTNAAALRATFPWTAPSYVGLRKSAGMGDRLGLATPGHLQAMQHAKGIVPILAQQSIREMERTHRTAENVMDAATWGVFQVGWREGFGSDADHLKTTADIDYCADQGFLWYTFDPRDFVDNDAEVDDLATLRRKYEALPWQSLHTTPAATRAAYVGKTWDLEGFSLTLNEEDLLRAACKYAKGLAHISAMYQHVVQRMGDKPFEVEVSVDESDTPTKAQEHLYIAAELKRLGVQWTSLAPRYIGAFEKGVDYIGDLAVFEKTFAEHVAIAKAFGPYKLSLHSGSDKFSIYPIAARLAGELVHLKTAGTSYLEALRAVARVDPALFREVLAFAIDHYEVDKASYHVSAQLSKMIAPETISDAGLPEVLDQFDTRQALHVTFGSVLTLQDDAGQYVFKDRLFQVLESHEQEHYAALEAHFIKHLTPFSN
jgi:hypothetical protein